MPDLVATVLTLVERSALPKWGLVTVLTQGGAIDRSFRIAVADAQAVHDGNNVLPPGVTQDEWNEGRVVVESRMLDAGEAMAMQDGSLIVNHGIVEANGRVDVTLTHVPFGDWLAEGGTLKLEPALALTLGAGA